MKKRNILLMSVVGLSLLLSSCTYDKDPYLEFKNEAKDAFNLYYEKNPGEDQSPLFYFDVETLRGALVNSPTDVQFLGQFNLSNFTFSENPYKYFLDVGNLNVEVNDTDGDGLPDDVKVGDYIKKDESGNITFDVKELVQHSPFVLNVVGDNGKVETISKVSKEGIIPDSCNAISYDPNFFYVSDFSINIPEFEQYASNILNFADKDMAILRQDIYAVLDPIIEEGMGDYTSLLDLNAIIRNNHRKVNNLKPDQTMPSTLKIEGTHYRRKNEPKEVVVGPNGVIQKLLNVFFEGVEIEKSKIHDVNTLIVGEGVTMISFFAFEGQLDSDMKPTSNIRNIYLPSTLQDVEFNAFQNLNLDNIYIPKTYKKEGTNLVEKEIYFMDIGNLDIKMGEELAGLELNVAPPFSGTTIRNLYFEDYSNLNINAFPYTQTSIQNIPERNKAIKIFHEKDQNISSELLPTLSSAQDTYDIINPFYQIDIHQEESKAQYVLESDLGEIRKDKVVYLPNKRYSLDYHEDCRSVINGNTVTNTVELNDSYLTLKLNKDLVVNGKLILSAQISRSENGSGAISGAFSSLDLNGHKLIIKDGAKVLGNGLIDDSSKEKTGEIIVENGGILTTNMIVSDYENFDLVEDRILDNVAPFDNYSFASLRTKVTFNQGSSFKTVMEYIGSDFHNENFIEYIGNHDKALFNIKKGSLTYDYRDKSMKSSNDNEVDINPVTLITITDDSSYNKEETIYDTKNLNFSIANKNLSFNLNKINLKSRIKVLDKVNFIVNEVNLYDNGSLFGHPNAYLLVNKCIDLSHVTRTARIYGYFKLSDEAFNLFKNEIKGSNEAKLVYSSIFRTGELDEEGNYVRKDTYLGLNFYSGNSLNDYKELIYKDHTGYYFSYTDKESNGKLLTNNGTTLASYSSNGNWIAKDGATSIDTNISSNDNKLLTSFGTTTDNYVLSEKLGETSWNKLDAIKPDGTYVINGEKFIKPKGSTELLKGYFLTDTPIPNSLFKLGNKNKTYYRYQDGSELYWVEVEMFDKMNTLHIVDPTISDKDIYAIKTGSKYLNGYTYDKLTHIATNKLDKNDRKAYTLDGYLSLDVSHEVKWDLKQIKSTASEPPFIYMETSGAWAEVYEVHNGVCTNLSKDRFYFLINDKWHRSVESTIAERYNKYSDETYGVLEEKISSKGKKYKFVLKEGHNPDDPYELFMPESMVVIEKKDYSELWPSGVKGDHFYAYRHITLNGKKYLYHKDSKTGKVTRQAFEFAPGFTPTDAGDQTQNIILRLNFIAYKVIFEGETEVRTIYINVNVDDPDSAIYAGDYNISSDGVMSDNYLALAIFVDESPLQSIFPGM